VQKRLLILEDEASLREFMVINLRKAGYTVYEADNGDTAIEIFLRTPGIDIAILDIMVPGADGNEVCRRIRERSRTCGIIMLSALSKETDKMTGFAGGADDYVTKPFSTSELLARVDVLYRRVLATKNPAGETGEIISGPFTLDLRTRSLYKNGKPVELTQVELLLIKYFMENMGTALSREDILNTVWGKDYYGELKIVDVNIRRLRVKIENDPADPQIITTIWGYGYKWVEQNEQSDQD